MTLTHSIVYLVDADNTLIDNDGIQPSHPLAGTGARGRDPLAKPKTFPCVLHAAEQDRPDVAAARKELKSKQPALKPSHLVFIDATAVTTKMTRLYGRAPVGERLVAKVPHGHWKTLTLLPPCASTA